MNAGRCANSRYPFKMVQVGNRDHSLELFIRFPLLSSWHDELLSQSAPPHNLPICTFRINCSLFEEPPHTRADIRYTLRTDWNKSRNLQSRRHYRYRQLANLMRGDEKNHGIETSYHTKLYFTIFLHSTYPHLNRQNQNETWKFPRDTPTCIIHKLNEFLRIFKIRLAV